MSHQCECVSTKITFITEERLSRNRRIVENPIWVYVCRITQRSSESDEIASFLPLRHRVLQTSKRNFMSFMITAVLFRESLDIFEHVYLTCFYSIMLTLLV